MLGIVPAFALLADPIVHGDADIVEKDFIGITAAVDRFDRPHGDAGRFHIDEQEGDALLLAAAIVGAHQREHPVGMLRLRGPYLLAVDHIGVAIAIGPCLERREVRSEEHTSELQSLMRISYAVFCLKKKKTKNNKHSEVKQQQSLRQPTPI